MKKRVYTIIILLLTTCFSNGQTVKIKRFGENDGLQQSHIHVIIQDKEGLIWLSSWDGLKCYDGRRFHNYKARPGDGCPLESNRINHIEELPDGKILCISQEKSYVFNPNTQTFLSSDIKPAANDFECPDSLKKQICTMPQYADIDMKIKYVDRQGGIWIYSSRGLERLSFVRSPIHPERPGTGIEEHVRLLYADSKGFVWIGSKDGFLRKSTAQGQVIGYLTPDGQLSEQRVSIGMSCYCMFEDSQGVLWIGTKGDGLLKLQPKQAGYDISRYTDKDGLPDNRIYSIVEDGYNRLWIGTLGGGLATITRLAENDCIIQNIAHTPVEAKRIHAIQIVDGVLIAATTEGLLTSKVMPDANRMKFRMYQRDPKNVNSLCNNAVMDVIVNPAMVILPTLGGGYAMLNRDQLKEEHPVFDYFSTEWSMASDENLTAVIDKENALWVVSSTTLSRIEQGGKTAAMSGRMKVENYTRSFFTKDFLFTEVRPLSLPDGRLLIGTTQGVLAFMPSEIRKSRYVPYLHVDAPERVVLSADERNFQLTFSALDYEQNEPIQYAWRMEKGADTTWHYTYDGNINFSSLSPGTHRLHLCSTNGDGVWVQNERVITIYQEAHVYERPWFYIIVGLLAALIIYVGWQALSLFRRQQRELQELKDMHLSSKQRISLLVSQLRELLPIGENPERLEQKAAEKSEEDHKFVKKTKAYIDAHLSDTNLRIEDIAREMCVSRTVFYYRIKELFNTTPNNLVTNMRIDRAQRMLREEGVQIVDVALKCGFSDAKYFSHQFKKLTGKTPSEYQGKIIEKGKRIKEHLSEMTSDSHSDPNNDIA